MILQVQPQFSVDMQVVLWFLGVLQGKHQRFVVLPVKLQFSLQLLMNFMTRVSCIYERTVKIAAAVVIRNDMLSLVSY